VSDGICNVAVVSIAGDIMPYHEMSEYLTTTPDDVRIGIDAAQNEPGILGILLRINSTGGTPAASSRMSEYIAESTLPVAAFIGDYGTSGAYLAASAADTIIASPYADVGSIGVTMSYLDNSAQNETAGINYVSLVSAPYKDYGNPDKPLTADERALLERDLGIFHEQFVSDVAAHRSLPHDEIAALANGASLPAKLALESHLIDGIGTDQTVRDWFAEKAGIAATDIIFCE
jgi:protease-4